MTIQPDTTFPLINARNLAGRPYLLPSDLDGEANIVIIAFQRWHQSLVDTWIAPMADLAETEPRLFFYEMATISRKWAPGRRFIDGGMSTNIGDPVVLARTLTAYIDLSTLMDPLGITDTSTIHTYLIDRSGTIYWQTAGAYAPEHTQSLVAALNLALEQTP